MSRVLPSRTLLASYPWSCILPTRYGDQDPNQHINNVAMVGLFEEGRVRFMSALGRSQHQRGFNTVIAALNTQFLAEAHYPLDVTMALGFSRMGRTSWTMVEGAFDGDKCLSVCEAVIVAVGPTGPVAAPEGWRDAAAPYFMRGEG